MPSSDAGINKPFDRILKSFAEEAPLLLLRLLGLIPPGIDIDIQPLRPESAPSVVLPDYVAVAPIGRDGERVIIHVEFQTHYHAEIPRDMARYGGSLAWQYRMQVVSVLLLLRPQGVPAEVPEIGRYRIADTETTHPFKVMRLWEMDPAPVLETAAPRLLPWAVLMKSSDAQVRELAAIVGRRQDQEAIGRFLILGGLRYHRELLEGMLGGSKMGLVELLLQESSIFKEAREEAVAEARVDTVRQTFRRILKKRLPELECLPEIEAISDPATLNALLDLAIDCNSADMSVTRFSTPFRSRTNSPPFARSGSGRSYAGR